MEVVGALSEATWALLSGLSVLRPSKGGKALILGARAQIKDPRRRGSQGRSHRAEFWVNRGKTS